jgi:hypothetical protein
MRHVATDAVDDAELFGLFECRRTAPETDDFVNRIGLAQSQRERPAYQADTEDNDFIQLTHPR